MSILHSPYEEKQSIDKLIDRKLIGSNVDNRLSLISFLSQNAKNSLVGSSFSNVKICCLFVFYDHQLNISGQDISIKTIN